MIRLLSCALLLLCSSAALAHPGHDTGFFAGALHPLTGIDHLLALLAVGWWSSAGSDSARSQTPRWWAAPVVFALSMFACALLSRQFGWNLPAVELQIALSLLVLGAMMLLQTRLTTRAGLLLIALLALGHGAAHGNEMLGPALPWLLGMLLATVLLHLAGVLIGFALRGRLAVTERLAGAGLLTFAAITLWSLLA